MCSEINCTMCCILQGEPGMVLLDLNAKLEKMQKSKNRDAIVKQYGNYNTFNE